MKKLQDRIGQFYYTHGLFCASHPWAIISFVIGSFLFTCYPLSNLPLPGETPSEYVTPVAGYRVPSSSPTRGTPSVEEDGERKPLWYLGPPVGYVQQIVVKGTVSPWSHEQLVPLDAFRAPLYTVFDIIDEINSFTYSNRNGSTSLSDICLRISEPVIKHIDGTLPKYSCLMVSPALLWQQEKRRFRNDPRIIKTVYERHYQTIEARPGLKEFLFGLPWRSTGIRKYFIRNRQRTVSYAITIVLKKYDPEFISALKSKLVHSHQDKNNGIDVDQISHLHYKNVNYFVEYTPLLVTYFVLLLYLYFSVSKIDMVKSKIGLAFSAVVSVVASLIMSVGLCTWFGLTPSLNGGEIFPYLVVIIGLENVLIITKSVVSTPVHLDVKYRTAQGLSKEGWYITKHLVTELGILLFGFLTFVPAIQEFCLFAVVGLLTDFYLQMVFFATVLSVDIRRMELSDLHKQNVAHEVNTQPGRHYEPLVRCPVMMVFTDPASTNRKHRSYTSSVSDPAGLASVPTYVDDRFCPRPRVMEIPKRLRFLFFWAKTRMFQRLIMISTVIWIGLIVYKTGLVEHLTSTDEPLPDSLSPTSWPTDPIESNLVDTKPINTIVEEVVPTDNSDQTVEAPAADWYQYYWKYDQEDSAVDAKDGELWRELSDKHWPSLFGCYNISLLGRYISILPPINLGVKISPQDAIKLRHPEEKTSAEATVDQKHSDPEQSELYMLKSLYDTKHLKEFIYDPSKIKEFYPKSKKELVITVWLGFLSVVVITYFMAILYKCMCSRRYDKWRVSWSRMRRKDKLGYYKQIKDSLPLILKGHLQEIECLVTDGQFIISSCLGGEIRVWDSFTGECLTGIIRKSVTPPPSRIPCLGRNMDDSDADLYAEYHGNGNSHLDHSCASRSASESSLFSPLIQEKLQRNPSKTSFDSEPDLSSMIDTDFSKYSCKYSNNQSTSSNIQPEDSSGASLNAFDFSSRFQDKYDEHHQLIESSSTSELSQSVQSLADMREYELDVWRSKSWSAGDSQDSVHYFANIEDSSSSEVKSTAIWCLACRDNLIVAGCGNGRLEFWDGATGSQKCIYRESTSAVTALCFTLCRIVVARLDGMIDFLEIETFQNPVVSPHSPKPHSIKSSFRTQLSSRHRSTVHDMKCWDDIIRCTKIQTVKAHQKPVNVLLCENGKVVSASEDHSLKVFRLEDCLCLYTFHGHTGSVTSLYLDKCPPYAAVSGSVDSTVRLWDLSTGTCIHKLNGHTGAITSIISTLYYIISMGLDDKLCVWERNRGLLMHKLLLDPCSSGMTLLTSCYLITGAKGSLYLWDINRGECLRRIKLDETDRLSFVQRIEFVGNSTIVCDYGTQLKVVRFPTILEKAD